jgi:tRNA1(Val) A37 N6-methylase TrmN6
MSNTNKKNLGQFYTTNYEYILQDMIIDNNITNIIEPFCGNGDLLNFINKDKYILETYDIEPKKNYIIKRNTLLNPPEYKNKFILTNPPYLARNKSKNTFSSATPRA